VSLDAQDQAHEEELLRDYEILYIVRPDLDDEQVAEAVQRVNTLIANSGGNGQRTDVWGRRRLAYEVDHLREGHYVLTEFEIEPERIAEMESSLKISDTVFRHLIVRRPPKTAAAGPAAPPPAPTVVEEPAAAVVEDTEPVEEGVESKEDKTDEQP
jgi:small subunit ribosomal protein S6